MRAPSCRSIPPAALLLAAAACLVPAAQAHIEIKPKRVPAGERVSLTFDIENESTTAGTRKVDMKLPRGIATVAPRAVRGWNVRLRRSGGEVARLILTAPAGREIPAGQTHGRFSFSMDMPQRPGATLAFKVLQTYEDGTIQRWIGPRSTETPAPTLQLVAGQPAREEQPQAPAPAAGSPGSDTAAGSDSGGDGGGNGVLIAVAAAIAVLGAVAAGVLWSRRRRTP